MNIVSFEITFDYKYKGHLTHYQFNCSSFAVDFLTNIKLDNWVQCLCIYDEESNRTTFELSNISNLCIR